MRKKIFLSFVGLFVGFMTATQSLSLTLYDDFSGARIDKNKWKQGEWVREIDDGKLIVIQASSNPATTTSFPGDEWNLLLFRDPNSVDSIQVEVTIHENTITNSTQTRARIVGFWYNDGTPGEGMAGDIQGEIRLKMDSSGLIADWLIYRLTNRAGTTGDPIRTGVFSTHVSIGTTYTLYAGYNKVAHQFTFRIGNEEVTVGPAGLPPWVKDASSPAKAFGTRVRFDNATSSGYIFATFDNIHKNGALYDDFSSSIIDQTKWTTYEFVREIFEGGLRSLVRSGSGSNSHIFNYLQLVDPSSINVFQAKVTPVAYENAEGANIRARIAGYYSHDGTPGESRIGDVGAQVWIGGTEWTGAALVAGWDVWRETDEAGDFPVVLASGILSTPISLGNTYTLFLGWDGRQFTFRIDDEEFTYTLATSINLPNVPWKEIGTRIRNPSGKEATIEALFDDVMVGQIVEYISLSSPLNGSVFDCCSLSTPPIFAWTSEESFKGYEIQFSPDQSFSSIPVRMKVKVKESTNEATLPAATWKKVLTMAGTSGEIVYWRIEGKRKSGTTGLSEVFSLEIGGAEAVGNPTLSPTSKSALPVLSWENNCNTKFKVWFGSDGSFTKKVPYSFSVKNPNEDEGMFGQGLASAQWKAVRKLVNDVLGSTVYWYVESWDGLGRDTKTDVMSFFLTD